MVSHVPVQGPRHHLQQTAVDRRQITIVGDVASAIRMQLVEVMAGSYDLDERAQVIAAFGVARVIGRQVAGDNVGPESWPAEQWAVRVLNDPRTDGAEVLPAAHVRRLVVLRRLIVWFAEIRVV